MNQFEAALRVVRRDLSRLKARYALVGGWAVTAHGSLRTTIDVDAVVAVGGDRDAEALVSQLRRLGYTVAYEIEQTERNAFGGVRLYPPGRGQAVLVDLLFASSGIEHEIVQEANEQKVFGTLTMPVVALGHLIAMKVLAESDSRGKDRDDLRVLLPLASEGEIDRARAAVALIAERGFSRHKDIVGGLERFIAQYRPGG